MAVTSESKEIRRLHKVLRERDRELMELCAAINNILAYKYCLKDGAGRDETNAGIQRALAQCERTILKVTA